MKSFLPAILAAGSLCASAHGALTVFGDDFESPSSLGETVFTTTGVPGWVTVGSATTGRFNADDDTGIAWYHSGSAPFTQFDDASGGTGGEVGNMDGPTKGYFFFGVNGDYIEILIGTLEPDTFYEAVIALSGSRTALADSPHGYSIDLISGSTVLNSSSGSAADVAALLFDDVSVGFDSTTLPGGVNYGDNLVFRITIDGAGNYLDFDNARFSETLIPEPSLSLLLALSGLTLLLRRRRD